MRYRCMGRLFPRFEERGKFAKHGGLRGRQVVSFGNILTDVVELPSTIFVIFNQLPIAFPNYGNRTSTEIGRFRLAGFFKRTLQISREMPKERTPGIGNRIAPEKRKKTHTVEVQTRAWDTGHVEQRREEIKLLHGNMLDLFLFEMPFLINNDSQQS